MTFMALFLVMLIAVCVTAFLAILIVKMLEAVSYYCGDLPALGLGVIIVTAIATAAVYFSL